MFDAIIYSTCKYTCYIILKIFCQIKLINYQNIPAKGPAIIACNHVSYLDPLIAGFGTRRRINFIARASLFKNPLFGWFLRRLGAFPLKREGGSDASAIKRSLRLLRSGKIVVIFPEGTRSHDGNLQKGQSGVGMLAFKSNAIVVPVCISGSEKALPRNSKFLKPAKIIARFGSPLIPTCGKERPDYQKFSLQVMQAIESLH